MSISPFVPGLQLLLIVQVFSDVTKTCGLQPGCVVCVDLHSHVLLRLFVCISAQEVKVHVLTYYIIRF